jgi:nicotinate-nucleotide adenylyltransferase
MSGVGLFGGVFDPPHNGHVALAAAAQSELGLDEVRILVAAAPGHKHVDTPAAQRLELAHAAFPDLPVELDEHERTIDTIRAHPEWRDAVFLLGADQLVGFVSWKEPEELLRLVRLGVATRPGYTHDQLEPVLRAIDAPDRVLFFDLEPWPVASRELREKRQAGEDVSGVVPAAVLAVIEREQLYRVTEHDVAEGYTDET